MRLRLEDVSSGYIDEVIKDISFEAEAGDFIGIIGPNGSGKTTLLRTIAKILMPRRGVIYINGKNLAEMDIRELAKILAVVPQTFQSGFEFKVEDVVLMGRTPYLGRFELESERDYKIALRAMRMVGCEHLIGRNIGELSGGELQKVIIARALAQEPKILLLDEPTAHLDINHQIEIMNLLRKLADSGVLIVAVIHDVNLALQFCSKLILMKDGKVVALGKPEEVVKAIGEIFDIDVIVRRNPITGKFYILPVKLEKIGGSGAHVICGGGSGAKLMLKLGKGTTGVLNVLDTDWEVATSLGFEIVSEAPFSPISEEAHEKNLRMIEKAEMVILADVPFGHGNLKNLEAAIYASELGKLIVIDRTPIERRDFTNGRATELYRKLKGKFVKDEDEAILSL